MKKIKGLIAAPFTAFDNRGELNLPMIRQQSAMLANNQIGGVLVGGTTGECGSLTIEERLTIAENWRDVTHQLPNFQVIVHAGHSCLKDSQKLAAHASDIKADAVAALPPYYFKPASVEILVEYCREIAMAAPELPFYYYHIPSISGVFFPVSSFISLLGDRIPNFAGVKFTHEDMYDFGLCLESEDRRYDMLCGRDESLLAGLALGATGAVGSTYNYLAPVYRKLIRAFEENDLLSAQIEQQRARQVIRLMIEFGGLSAGKAIMRMIGVDCGPVRLPLSRISESLYQLFKNELDKIGFSEFSSSVAPI